MESFALEHLDVQAGGGADFFGVDGGVGWQSLENNLLA
jgi:hypothetical protein